MDRLEGSVQSYAWGDTTVIAELQRRPPTGRPEAELWFGAHPVAPSRLVTAGRSLAEAVEDRPAQILGPAVADRFGRLPYLLKVLAAAEPLSIQAHPTKAQAEAGFGREEAAGVAWDSPTRTYRDANHKPELICALTPFEAKCGFRPLDDTLRLVEALVAAAGGRAGAPGLVEVLARLRADAAPPAAVASALAWLLDLAAAEAGELVAEAVTGAEAMTLAPADGCRSFDADLRWTVELDRFHPGDVGVIVALMLNHVKLAPGQALFLPAGNLHSYLRGAAVELMANSDNVVRGGLTSKHVDRVELQAVVDTTPGPAPVQNPAGVEHTYHCPVPDFSLTRHTEGDGGPFDRLGPDVVLVTAGRAEVSALGTGEQLSVASGEAVLIAFSDGAYSIRSDPGSVVWRATVGDLSSR